MSHQTLQRILSDRFTRAIAAVAGRDPAEIDAGVRPSSESRFGDYQCNAAMPLARLMKLKPREIAERIVAAVELADVAEPLEIAGTGFINVRLRNDFLARFQGGVPAPPEVLDPTPGVMSDRMGIAAHDHPQRVIVDYSSPNIAKRMHVGHIRSTIIGDVFARVLMFQGHRVIRQNHVGDWGTSIGMVIVSRWYLHALNRRGVGVAGLRERMLAIPAKPKRDAGPAERAAWNPENRLKIVNQICAEWSEELRRDLTENDPNAFARASVSIDELELGYQFVQRLMDAAEDLNAQITLPLGQHDDLTAIPRKTTRMLQEGGAANSAERMAWEQTRATSLAHCQECYDRLRVLLTMEDVCGESFYNDRLAPVVAELRVILRPQSGAAHDRPYAEFREDQGARCVFLYNADGSPQFKTQSGDPLPLIVQKSDGAFLYASTDLAAIHYRVSELNGKRLIYVTDGRQAQHFQMFFAAARAAGFAGADVSLEHTWFGSITDENGQPLRTRSGENIKLFELLDEAEQRAYDQINQREEAGRDIASPMTEVEKRSVARRVGVAAIKYFDLNRDRKNDYKFSWDEMLSMQGNTAPYILYAYARIRSIYRKAAEHFGAPDIYRAGDSLRIEAPAERDLVLRLARLPDVIDAVATDLLPHLLCTYLYDLAGDFMRFYESCPVMKAADEPTRLSRMRLCDLTARSLKLGLGLLGIETIERM